MSKVLLIVGFGPGVSASVAERFGREGFSIAVVSREVERHRHLVEALRAKGVQVASFQADAAEPLSMQNVLEEVRAKCGPISAILWNAFGGEPRDLLTAGSESIRSIFDIAVLGFLATVQACLPDLERARGVILVTNGSSGEIDPQMDRFVAGLNTMGLKLMGTALANAAKDKLVGMLGERLEANGIYVGQVTIDGTVKGTAWDRPDSIDPNRVADAFWELHRRRDTRRIRLSSTESGWVRQQG